MATTLLTLLVSSRNLRLPSLAAAQASPIIRAPHFLSNDDVDRVHAAAAYVSSIEGVHALDKRQRSPSGTWNTIFLNHHLHELLPDIHERLFDAARQADGGHLLDQGRGQLSLRVAEYSTVSPGGGLRAKYHHDEGSLLTLDVMLSSTDDFEVCVYTKTLSCVL